MEPHRLTPNAVYVHINDNEIILLSHLIESFGFKCIKGLNCSIDKIKMKIATFDCQYDFKHIVMKHLRDQFYDDKYQI